MTFIYARRVYGIRRIPTFRVYLGTVHNLRGGYKLNSGGEDGPACRTYLICL